MNSLEIYNKLCVKVNTPRSNRKQISKMTLSESDNMTIGEGFYITEKKSYRTKSAEVVKRVENSLINFEKQLPRPDFNRIAPPAHENRFISFNDCPPTSTKHRPINSPKFSLCLGRTQRYFTEVPTDYSPNFKAIERDTQKGLVPFEKIQGRKEIHKHPTSSYQLKLLDYSTVDPHVSSPLMEKSPPRRINPELPLFMDNRGYRGKNISLKTLEMNGYMEGKYMPLTSGFGSNWKQRPSSFPIPIKGRCPKIVKILKEKLSVT